MTLRTRCAFVIVLVSLPLLTGCFYSREIAVTQREVARQMPEVEFRRQFMLSLGPGTLGSVSGLGSFIPNPDARQFTAYVRDLRRVKIGVYELDGASMAAVNPSIIRHMQGEGWQTAVRVRDEEGKMVTLMYRERYGEVRDLYVFSLDDSDLVVAKLSGNFTTLVRDVMADHPEWFRLPGRQEAGSGEQGVSDAQRASGGRNE